MNRAYSSITLKAVDEDRRILTGIATTPSTDRMGDVVEPKGAEFQLPIPFLWQHDSSQPIGHVIKAKVTSSGIEVEVQIAKVSEPGRLKDRLDEAWQSIKAGLVRGLSIGFKDLESARIKDSYGLHFLKWLWLELSAVTIAAHQDASITTIKSIDDALLAASGKKQGASSRPGVSGSQSATGGFSPRTKGKQMKTMQELVEMRTQKAARMTELIDLKKAESRVFTEEEGAEFDNLSDEVKELDDEIRVARFTAMNAATAKAVDGSSTKAATESRGGLSFVKKQDPDDEFQGQAFTRYLISKAAAFVALKNGSWVTPADVAAHRWGKTHPNLVNYIKAAVAGGGTGSGEWGAELAASDSRFTGDFVQFLYAKTVFDRLPLRSVPARVHVKGQDGAATGYWVGESKAIPVSKPDFSTVELTPLKVGVICPCSRELIASSSPSAELWIRDAIVNASAQRVDGTFLSATAASAGVSPAGLLNGLSGIAASGTDAAAVRADIQALLYPFVTAKMASGISLVMNPATGLALSMLVNALGQSEFPGLNENGGTFQGRPTLTGDNVTPGNIIAIRSEDVWKIGDAGIEVSMSDSATIEQNDAPQGAGDTPTAASATLMSLWQTEQVGFKVVRSINYAKRRSNAVTFIQDAEYGGVVS